MMTNGVKWYWLVVIKYNTTELMILTVVCIYNTITSTGKYISIKIVFQVCFIMDVLLKCKQTTASDLWWEQKHFLAIAEQAEEICFGQTLDDMSVYLCLQYINLHSFKLIIYYVTSLL
jgi:hypothetical protein